MNAFVFTSEAKGGDVPRDGPSSDSDQKEGGACRHLGTGQCPQGHTDPNSTLVAENNTHVHETVSGRRIAKARRTQSMGQSFPGLVAEEHSSEAGQVRDKHTKPVEFPFPLLYNCLRN